jgi:predicted Zn-ribbon and HTH transcriptional regulator
MKQKPLHERKNLTRRNLELHTFISSQQTRTVRLEMYQAVIVFCQEQIKHELEQLGENMRHETFEQQLAKAPHLRQCPNCGHTWKARGKRLGSIERQIRCPKCHRRIIDAS